MKVLNGLKDGNSIDYVNRNDLDEIEYSNLSSYGSNIDENSIYKTLTWKRANNTIYAISTLIGSSPNYNQLKIEYYGDTGISIVKTVLWDVLYDENNFPYQKVVV